MSIAANKVQKIRAAVTHDVSAARRAQEHNDANVSVIEMEERKKHWQRQEKR